MTLKSNFLLFIILSSNFIFSQTTLNVSNYGAISNDGKDDTSAFQQCVDDLAKNNGGTMIIPKGTYNISHLKFFGKKYSNISIVGNGATIIQTTPPKRISVHNGLFKTFAERYAADGCFVFDAQVSNQKDDSNSIKNISITGLTFSSNVDKKGFDELLHQISAHGVSNFTVTNSNFIGFLGDGIAINAGTDLDLYKYAYNKNITIKNCNFDGINKDNRQGISIYYADGFLIDQCNFKNITRNDMPGAIDIEPNEDTQISRNGVISNCTFENIGGLGAVTIHTRKSLASNDFSNKNFLIENCTFNKVRSPFCFIGNENFLNYNSTENVIIVKNSMVTNSQSIADIRSGFGILFDNVKFYNINNVGLNTVTDAGANMISFNNCLFSNISNNNGIGFYGETKNINFANSTFEKFAAHAITINDPKGIGNISQNTFSSSSYGDALPIVTSTINNNTVISKAIIKNNKTSGNFKIINLKQFYKK